MHSGISSEICQGLTIKRQFWILKERPLRKATAIIRFEVPGSQVEEVLSKLPGIKEYSVNHANGILKIEYDPEVISSDKIRKSVNNRL